MRKIILVFSLFISMLIILCGVFIYSFLLPVKDFENKKIKISTGDNFQEVYKDLGVKYNILDKVYFKVNQKDSKIKTGYFVFDGKFSKYKIIKKIVNNRVDNIKLTIPEGFTQNQVIERMEKLGLGTKEEINTILKNKDFPYPHPEGNFEGYFFPDTYTFPEGTPPEIVLDRIFSEFLKYYPEEKYPSKDEFYKTLILASIVEKEVNRKEDKTKVAGVFMKRLEIDMRLESDATLKYVLGRQAKRGELKTNTSVYNSYIHKGLPPTPIANPSKDTFDDTVNYEKIDELFFFMYDGKTYYSKTHDEHLQKRRESGQLK